MTHYALYAGGLAIVSGDGLRDVVLWADIDRVVAYKRDLLLTDALCLAVITHPDGGMRELREELAGFWDVATAMSHELPAFDEAGLTKVVLPPFATNTVVLYDRTDSRPRPAPATSPASE